MSGVLIDGLQYANWSERIFRQMREGGVDAVHVTIAYHETFRETVLNVERWNRWFERHPDLIVHARTGDDVRRARAAGRTAIVFGFQNPSPIEDDIGLVEIVHTLGARFMQLSYNNQSLLATGAYEAEDPGLTRMGRQVIAEMNRVGLAVDMSHSAERSTLEAIELSSRPIAITHANPASWHAALRNKSDTVLTALAESGGMLGFSQGTVSRWRRRPSTASGSSGADSAGPGRASSLNRAAAPRALAGRGGTGAASAETRPCRPAATPL
ncbi:MAG TPA: membrane dipeptidase [Thermohalobaculum sp.]|nr:membrane dipeptidase [Thermohalobaculum sp.]